MTVTTKATQTTPSTSEAGTRIRVIQLFISNESGEQPYSYAEVFIEGLGLVSTKDCVTNSARAAIFKDVTDHIRKLLELGRTDANQNQ